MPSRKKAKGQARKAAKVKNEAAEKARELEELIRDLEQAQIQWLQISNAQRQRSVFSCICMHRFDPFPNGDICSKFIRAFVHDYYCAFLCTVRKAFIIEREVIGSLMKARDGTKDEYSEVWNSADKMKQVISYFLHNGTMNILANENNDTARDSAMLARFFEQWLKVKVHKSQACIHWLKLIVTIHCKDKHSLVKYFWRRTRCSCLDGRYKEVKSMPKKGMCLNLQCSHPNRTVERCELRCCSRCRGATYCSRECQAADWALHKEFCDEVVTAKAEFDASQQQQS